QLHALLEGVAFIARTAAKRRSREAAGKKVVMHPIALKYLFDGDLDLAADGVLSDIEQRLSWRPQRQLKTDRRIAKVGFALLTLKELEFFNATYQDDTSVRHVINAVNLDHILWATDFPHGDGTYPHSREIAKEVTEGMSPEQRHAVVYGNAAALYGF
ncbi:MAG: amidohydrolase family protein, partial [Myxococcota bacterium]